jgi:PadR family transcriptional regulator PadR
MKSSGRVSLPVVQDDDCPCAGRSLAKLLQPAILAALTQGDAHGYVIVQRLSEMPMSAGEKPDPTGVYRFLRQMEERGHVTSEWDVSRAGPAKRLYHITESGRACLRRWVDTLSEYRDAIGHLLEITRAGD